MFLIINTPQTEQLLVQVQPGMFGRGKNVYNLIPIRNTGSKVKENVSCKRSNKNSRSTKLLSCSQTWKKAAGPQQPESSEPQKPNGSCHSPQITVTRVTDYLITCSLHFHLLHFLFLPCWPNGQSPNSLISAREATTPYFFTEMGNSRKKKVHLQQNVLNTTKLWISHGGHAYRAQQCWREAQKKGRQFCPRVQQSMPQGCWKSCIRKRAARCLPPENSTL